MFVSLRLTGVRRIVGRALFTSTWSCAFRQRRLFHLSFHCSNTAPKRLTPNIAHIDRSHSTEGPPLSLRVDSSEGRQPHPLYQNDHNLTNQDLNLESLSLPTLTDLGLREGDNVVVAMSGGVDSSLALQLLSKLPLNLSVIFMRNWDPLLSESETQSTSSSTSSTSPFTYKYTNTISSYSPSLSSSISSSDSPSFSTMISPTSKVPNTSPLSPCQWEKDYADVRLVASHVGIPESRVKLVDLSKEYWGRVFEPSIMMWEDGGTPNPDVACNREIKFGALFEHIPSGHFLATGHYARVKRDRHDTLRGGKGARPTLHRAKDMNKDQTYYLSQLNEEQLSRAVFPLANLSKPDVRRLAKYFNLPTASREESMGVCFIGERSKFGDFVSQYTSPPTIKGHFVTPSGEKVQSHTGQWYYTIGQRARISGMQDRWFVAKKNVGPQGEDILVVPGSDHPALSCVSVHSDSFHWIAGHPPLDEDSITPLASLSPSTSSSSTSPLFSPFQSSSLTEKEHQYATSFRAHVQVRHRMSPVSATVHLDLSPSTLSVISGKNRVTVVFDNPISGVARGQVVGIWKDDMCLGSGMIDGTRCADEAEQGDRRDQVERK